MHLKTSNTLKIKFDWDKISIKLKVHIKVHSGMLNYV
jgi:hypothetical protein